MDGIYTEALFLMIRDSGFIAIVLFTINFLYLQHAFLGTEAILATSFNVIFFRQLFDWLLIITEVK